jgi:acyl carrier protein
LQLIPKNQAAAASPVESIREKLLEIEAGGRRRAALEAHLQEKLAAVLNSAVARVDPARPFGSMGVDSLTALEFVRRLAVSTSLRLSATTVFNYPTIQVLAREIAKRMEIPLEADGPAVSVAAAAGAPGAGSTAIPLTDEEAIAVLTGKGNRAK